MCCISGSFDKEELKSFIEAGYTRAGHSYSITQFHYDMHSCDIYADAPAKFLVNKDSNEIMQQLDSINWLANPFVLVHQQAPTTSARDITSVHPSIIETYMSNSYMWHNGIIKEESVKLLQNTLNMATKWDTALLHALVSSVYYEEDANDIDILNNVRGGYACVMFDSIGCGSLIALRNSVCPLFYRGNIIDGTLALSSVKTSDTLLTVPENTFVDLVADYNLQLSFNSVEKPYIFDMFD